MVRIRLIRAMLTVIGFVFYSQTCLSTESEDEQSLSTVKKLFENIKNDKTNDSFRDMLYDKIMEGHTLSRHEKGQPYFYGDDLYVITDIINLVLEEPEGIIDETAKTGILKIYRESNYPEEIEELFDREKRAPRKFQNAYLGETITGPTNKVMVVLKIKGDEQNEDTLEKRLTYLRNNIQYIDAYPVKGSPVEHKPEETKPEETKLEEEKAEESKSEEDKAEETKPEEEKADKNKAEK